MRLKVRPGDYIPQRLPVADILPPREDAKEVFSRSLTFGSQPAALQDLEYSIRQLTEIAVRALSPGINDPFTAGSVLERLGDALCRIAPRFLATGAIQPETERSSCCTLSLNMEAYAMQCSTQSGKVGRTPDTF